MVDGTFIFTNLVTLPLSLFKQYIMSYHQY